VVDQLTLSGAGIIQMNLTDTSASAKPEASIFQ
jgi:hypothetical protein